MGYNDNIYIAEGRVANVYLKDKITADNIIHKAGSVDVFFDKIGLRFSLSGVRSVSDYSLDYSSLNLFGWFKLPEPGDSVLIAWIEGLSSFPICLGRTIDVFQKAIWPSEGLVFQDALYKHVSGSWLRFRNLESTQQKSAGFSKIRSELRLHHRNGDEIVFNEPSGGQSTITISHNSGALIQIDSLGNITATPATGKKFIVNGDSAEVVGSQFLALKSDVENLRTDHINHTHLYIPGPGSGTVPSATPTQTPQTVVGTAKLKAS